MSEAQQPEALRLAAICESKGMFSVADELSRMHARLLELEQGKCLHQIAEPAVARREAFEAWARSYGTWEVQRDDSQELGLTGYTDVNLSIAWHAVQSMAAAPQAVRAAGRVYLVATGEVRNGMELYERHDTPVPLAECEVLYTAPAHPAEGVRAQAFQTKVYQALGIGSACDEHVVFVNIENLIRRADCLSAIEREFFMIETPPDESEGDTEPGEECLLNWGHTPEQYVKQFAEALATHPTQQGLDRQQIDPLRQMIAQHQAHLEQNQHAYFELAYTRSTGWMVWITDKPLCSPVVNPDRKVLWRGQGDTPDEACENAALAAQAKQGGV